MNYDHSETTDTEDDRSIDEIYEESVTSQAEPFDSFDSFDGYTEEKRQLRDTVVEPAGYDQYVTSSALLVGEHIDCQTTTLAKGVTGEVDDDYTFFHVDSITGEYSGQSSLDATLEAAKARAPSLVIVSCLDEFGFGETEYECLRIHIESLRRRDERVIVICTATDRDASLTSADSLFEVTVEVPKPGEEFRCGVIESELAAAEAAGVAEPTQLDCSVYRKTASVLNHLHNKFRRLSR